VTILKIEKIATRSAQIKIIVVILSIQFNQTMRSCKQMPCIAPPETPRRDMNRPIYFQRLRSPPFASFDGTTNSKPQRRLYGPNPTGRKSGENLDSPSLPWLFFRPQAHCAIPRAPISCVAPDRVRDEEAGEGEPVRDLLALPQVRGGRGLRPPVEAGGGGGRPCEARVRLPHRGAQGLPLPRELRQRHPLRGPQGAQHHPHS
jgi:hypothetical protein